MTVTDVAVILFGLFAGYWVVSKLFFRPPKTGGEPHIGAPPAAQASAPAWYDTLQVAPSATVQQIREAYKVMMSQYHPDKVDRMGPEIREFANRKSQEIGAAYREAMRARGEEP